MLVSRKQEWLEYQQPEETKASNRTVLNRSAADGRRKGLQLIFLLVAVAMLITVHNEAIVRSGYDLVEMKGQAAKLEKENELLKLEIAKLKAPQRIQQIATTQLGMVPPQQAYYAATPGKAARPGGAGPENDAQVAGLLKMNKAEASKGP